MKLFTDENGNKYELTGYKLSHIEDNVFTIKPIKEAEKRWEVSEVRSSDVFMKKSIIVSLDDATEAQAEAVSEAIKALLEYVHTPYSLEIPPLTPVTLKGREFIKYAEETRQAVQEEV